MLVSEAVRQFYFYLGSNGHSRRTARLYRAVLETLPDMELAEVTPGMLQDQVNGWNAVAGSTRNLRKSAIRSFFNYLVDAGHLDKNPARLLKAEKVPQREAAYLEPEEVNRFREAIKSSPRDELLFSAYLMCGFRLRELLRLDIKDVHGKDVIAIIGKGKKARQIFLSPFLTGLVKKVIAGRSDSEPLFESSLGHRLSASRTQAVFKAYLRKADITDRYGVHSLRHTFLTHLYSKTKDLRLCQEAAGHSSIGTTQRYCHISQGQLQSAVTGLYQ